jgi:hypothetical protein
MRLSPNFFKSSRNFSQSGGSIHCIASQSVRFAEHNILARSAGKIPAALLWASEIAMLRDKFILLQNAQISAKSFASCRSIAAVILLARIFYLAVDRAF